MICLKRKNKFNLCEQEEDIVSEFKKIRITISPGQIRLSKDIEDITRQFPSSSIDYSLNSSNATVKFSYLSNQSIPIYCSFFIKISKYYPHSTPEIELSISTSPNHSDLINNDKFLLTPSSCYTTPSISNFTSPSSSPIPIFHGQHYVDINSLYIILKDYNIIDMNSKFILKDWSAINRLSDIFTHFNHIFSKII